MLSTVAIQVALPWPVASAPHDRRHQLCRRPRHRPRAMGGRGRHAGGHPDGLHSGIPARDLLRLPFTPRCCSPAAASPISSSRSWRPFSPTPAPAGWSRAKRSANSRSTCARSRASLTPTRISRRPMAQRSVNSRRFPTNCSRRARSCSNGRGKWASACGLRPRSASCWTRSMRSIAAQCDVELIRNTPEAAAVLARIGDALRVGSLDLRHLSLELLTTGHPTLPPDHQLAIDALKREAARVEAARDGSGSARGARRRRPGGSFCRSVTSDAWSRSLSNDATAQGGDRRRRSRRLHPEAELWAERACAASQPRIRRSCDLRRGCRSR